MWLIVSCAKSVQYSTFVMLFPPMSPMREFLILLSKLAASLCEKVTPRKAARNSDSLSSTDDVDGGSSSSITYNIRLLGHIRTITINAAAVKREERRVRVFFRNVHYDTSFSGGGR